MSREAAKKIVDLMIKHGAEQNAVLAEIQSICADDEFQRYKQMIGQSMGCMLASESLHAEIGAAKFSSEYWQ